MSRKMQNEILIHHNNAPADSAKGTKDILGDFQRRLLQLRLYSQDLASSDFFFRSKN